MSLVKRICERMDKLAPLVNAEAWDNVGLLLDPISSANNGILLTNDLTLPVVKEAISSNSRIIISYHPPIFKSITRLLSSNVNDSIIMQCVQAGIAIYSPHTSLDASELGLNDFFMKKISCTSDKFDNGAGRIGNVLKVTDINEFLLTKHPTVQFKKAYFTGENDDLRYDCIYLIELLEHLSEPYVLLKQCQNVLSENGKIFLTTATNIPQFDHLYNFEASHQDFEKKIQNMGLSIFFMEDIPHQFITLDIGAKNRFYVLKKDSSC